MILSLLVALKGLVFVFVTSSLEGLNLITIFVRQSKTMWIHALKHLLEVTN